MNRITSVVVATTLAVTTLGVAAAADAACCCASAGAASNQVLRVTRSGSTWFTGVDRQEKPITVLFSSRFATVERGRERIPVSYLRAGDRVAVAGRGDAGRLIASRGELIATRHAGSTAQTNCCTATMSASPSSTGTGCCTGGGCGSACGGTCCG